MMKTFAVTMALLMAVPSVASSDTQDSSFVRLHALDLLDGILTKDQTVTLQLLAHQTAIANVCNGFTVDDGKFQKSFDTLAASNSDKMSDVQKDYFDKHLLVSFGILVGGEMAAIGKDPAGACKAAAEEKSNKDFANVMVWK
ncbi:hypothetical protein M1D80_03320 (plasmid) [Phyllobacteriaceae bacterium JZ32]